MRSFLFGALALAAVACGEEVSLHPPGSSESSDAGAVPATPSASPSTTPAPPHDAGAPPLPAADASTVPICHGCVDAGHDAAPPVHAGGCPASCVEEPVGVPPCAAPLHTCDCPNGSTAGSACKPTSSTQLSCCP